MSTNPRRGKRQFALVVAVIAPLLAVSALLGAFGFSSVCTRCGAIRDTIDWQIPLTRVTLFRTSSEHQTPISTELLRSGVVSKHEHQWLFSSGGGIGGACALGSGRYIRPAVQSVGVAAVLAAAQRFGEVQLRDRIVQLMFGAKTSEAVFFLGSKAPTNGFSDATQFRAWLSREKESFEETVTMYQKP